MKTIEKYITLLFLGISLTSNPLASVAAEYQPPKDEPPPSGYTRATGSRGYKERCQADIPLTLLAPYTHVGQTTSEHPVLAWYVPVKASIPMEVSIYQEDADRRPQLLQTLKLTTSPGIFQVALPKDKPGLQPGKRYIWQVAILCNPKRRSSDLVASAEIDVVANSSAKDNSSFWYDIFSSSLNTAKTTQLTRSSLELLTQLAELEKQQGLQGSARRDRLMQIINSENLVNANSQ